MTYRQWIFRYFLLRLTGLSLHVCLYKAIIATCQPGMLVHLHGQHGSYKTYKGRGYHFSARAGFGYLSKSIASGGNRPFDLFYQAL
jgi:hypothetical protein